MNARVGEFTKKALLAHIKNTISDSIVKDQDLINFAEAWNEVTKTEPDPRMSIKNDVVKIHNSGVDKPFLCDGFREEVEQYNEFLKKNLPLGLDVVLEKERLKKELASSEAGDVIGTSLTMDQALWFVRSLDRDYTVESDSEGVYILCL